MSEVPTTSARLRRYALNLELYTDDGKLEELAVLISGEADHVERLEAERERLREQLNVAMGLRERCCHD